jgi:hypothetical protein
MQWIPDPTRTYLALRDLVDAAPETTDPIVLAAAREVLDTWDEAREEAAAPTLLLGAGLHGLPREEHSALVSWLDTVFHGLGALRTGALRTDKIRDQETLATIIGALVALEQRLLPRLQGLSAALVRAHYAAGGKHSELAAAMDVPVTTATSRASVVRIRQPSTWENWATGDVPVVEHRAGDLRPGWKIADDLGRWLSVEEVTIYSDHLVEVSVGAHRGVVSYVEDEPIEAKVHAAPFDEIRGTRQTEDGELSFVTFARPRAASLEDR